MGGLVVADRVKVSIVLIPAILTIAGMGATRTIRTLIIVQTIALNGTFGTIGNGVENALYAD